MFLMDFSIVPLGKGESLSSYVARCVRIVAKSGLDYRLHAMGTIVEGEFDQLVEVLRGCFDELAADCNRVTCNARFDWRRDSTGRIESKVASVKANLQS